MARSPFRSIDTRRTRYDAPQRHALQAEANEAVLRFIGYLNHVADELPELADSNADVITTCTYTDLLAIGASARRLARRLHRVRILDPEVW